MTPFNKIYEELKYSLILDNEFQDALYNLQKHYYFRCDNCPNNCETVESLNITLDFVVMEELLEYLLGEGFSRTDRENKLKEPQWRRLYNYCLETLRCDKRFTIKVLIKMLLNLREPTGCSCCRE